jgi:DNA-binding CsgD family transcriptional regulator
MTNPFEQFIGISYPDDLPLLDKAILQNKHIHIYWKDVNSQYYCCNDQMASDIGLSQCMDVFGYGDRDLWPGSMDSLKAHDAMVHLEEKPIFFVEEGIHPTHILKCISYKKPWYSSQTKKILGVMGVSIITHKNYESDTQGLTKRQLECLYYLVKGCSVKQIAAKISLSHRTVEHYLEAIKFKLKCSSRRELIEKALKISAIKDKL